jgi:hypothetical protein
MESLFMAEVFLRLHLAFLLLIRVFEAHDGVDEERYPCSKV